MSLESANWGSRVAELVEHEPLLNRHASVVSVAPTMLVQSPARPPIVCLIICPRLLDGLESLGGDWIPAPNLAMTQGKSVEK